MEDGKKHIESLPIIIICFVLLVIVLILTFLWMTNFVKTGFIDGITGNQIEAGVHAQVTTNPIEFNIKTSPPYGSIDYFIAVPIGILILAFAFVIIKRSLKKN